MPTTDVAQTVPLQTPRVVKCPTPQCPGWITFDSTRHQTEPCRYCRIGVDTLRFLLSRVGADNKALPPQVHDEFNRLMLNSRVFARKNQIIIGQLDPGYDPHNSPAETNFRHL